MPIHDWTLVDAGTYHQFHHQWTDFLCIALNEGVLPPGYFAMLEQRIKGPVADVLALELAPGSDESADETQGGLAVASAPPRTQLVRRTEKQIYAELAKRITIRHRHGKVVTVVEIVSPGNKGSKADFRAFIEKSAELIRKGIHLMILDLFPPGKRDPQGMHKAIWDEFEDADFAFPPGKNLTFASYDAGDFAAYANFAAVGDTIPETPLFFQTERYVTAPLEQSYQTAWKHFPAPLKGLLEGPKV